MYQQPPSNQNVPTYTPPEQPYSQDPQPPPQSYPSYPPPPYQQLPPPKRKRRVWLWIVCILVILFIIGAFASRGGTTTSTPPVATNAPATGSTPAATQAPATTAPTSNVSKVGGTITLNDVATTLVSVKRLAADQYTQPKAGNEFIVVHVKIVNHSTGEVDYNPFDFHVRSGAGNITDEEFSVPSTYTGNNELSSGKLSAGGNVEGDLIFQVKKGDHASQLTWQPSFFGNAGENAWNLGL
jgi:Domain of unknown function (DUF4352)